MYKSGSRGVVIQNNIWVTMTSRTVKENSGGGVYMQGGTLTLEDGTVISGNTASDDGGIYLSADEEDFSTGYIYTLTRGTVTGNSATGNSGRGGGVRMLTGSEGIRKYDRRIFESPYLNISGNTASGTPGGAQWYIDDSNYED